MCHLYPRHPYQTPDEEYCWVETRVLILPLSVKSRAYMFPLVLVPFFPFPISYLHLSLVSSKQQTETQN